MIVFSVCVMPGKISARWEIVQSQDIKKEVNI